MDWEKLLSTKRFKKENNFISEYIPANRAENPSRSEYHQDHDRIVFSRSFRRLGRKTQVHPLATNDHTHNRLTHSVEVGAVGRSIGIKVGQKLKSLNILPESATPEDIGAIVQVACLAHDIGNPPFGHAGEESLREWFTNENNKKYLLEIPQDELNDLQTYEGNAHALRIVCTTEMYKQRGGMRLSCATIGSLLKYPWVSSEAGGSGKFNIYQSELEYFKLVAKELGLKEITAGKKWARHPLSFIMEAADDICYSVLDIEDAVEMGIVSISEFSEIFKEFSSGMDTRDLDKTQYCALARSKFIGSCIDFVSDEFINNYNDIIQGLFTKKDFFKDSNHPTAQTLKSSKKFAAEKIYTHPNKVKREVGSYPCLHHLLDLFIPTVNSLYEKNGDISSLNNREKTILKLLDKVPSTSQGKYLAYLEILDFIGGMTDNYAINLATETSGFSRH